MKPRLAGVLLAALLLESLNFFLLTPPLDIERGSGTPWYVKVLDLQWALVHIPALFSLDWFERILGCHDGNVVAGCAKVDTAVIFIGGYLTTALLLFAIAYLWQRIHKPEPGRIDL